MGKSSRVKGYTYEVEALKILQKTGINCRRSAASGAQEGYIGDIEVGLYKGLEVEVKYSTCDRGTGVIRRYVEPVDLLMARAPGEGWLFVFKEELATKLLRDAHRLSILRESNPQLFTDEGWQP